MFFFMLIIKYFIAFICFVNVCFGADVYTNPTFIKLEGELNKVKTAKGKMVQYVNGESTPADFAISIPGRLRINYPKHQLSLIVNNGVLIYYDAKLDQKSQTINFNNPFLKSLNLLSLKDTHYTVTNLTETEAEVVISVSFTVDAKEETYNITFTKIQDSFNLSKIQNTTKGVNMIVTFSNITINETLPKNSFTIENKKIDKNFNF